MTMAAENDGFGSGQSIPPPYNMVVSEDRSGHERFV